MFGVIAKFYVGAVQRTIRLCAQMIPMLNPTAGPTTETVCFTSSSPAPSVRSRDCLISHYYRSSSTVGHQDYQYICSTSGSLHSFS